MISIRPGRRYAFAWLLTPIERFRRSEELFAQYLAMGGSLDPDPIRQVLSTIHKHQLQALLMGGQACVLYGAAQFSKDIAALNNPAALRPALDSEMREKQEKDRAYWEPLKRELESFRLAQARERPGSTGG